MNANNGPEDEPQYLSENETEQTEDDLLSEIWDAEEFDESGSGATPPVSIAHEYVQIKTVSGVYKVDLTPPEIQVKGLEASVSYYYRKRMADECLKDAIKKLTLTRIVDGDEKPWKLAQCHAMIAKIYWNLKNYPEQTIEHATDAQRLLSFPNRSGEKPEKSEIVDTAILATYLLGRALLALKRYDEALQEMQKAEKLLEQRRRLGDMKEKNYWLTEISAAMARIHTCQNNTPDALRYLRRVEKVMQKKYGGESPKLIPLYQEIARLEEASGKLDAASELYLKSYSIAKSSFDDQNPLMGDTALALARVYAKSKEDDAEVYAETYFNEAIASYMASLGSTDPKTITAYQELSQVMAALDRPSDGISLLNQCLRNLSAVGEEYEAKAAKVYKQLAELCSKTGRNRQAVQYLKHCLQVETMHYGPNSKRARATKEALTTLTKASSADRGQSLDRRPRFSAVVTESVIDAGRKLSWDK